MATTDEINYHLSMIKCAQLVLLFVLLHAHGSFALTEDTPRYFIKRRSDISFREKSGYFAATYVSQWVYYLTAQRSIIQEHGSLRNWYTYPFKPHFDKDSFDYNIFKHSLTGNYYYLWYRSRGYVRKDALFWTFMSSLAFEFTVETATERPSWQDIYQTPVFGTVLGIGVEKLSLICHRWDTWYGHTLGYLLNPMTLVPKTEEQLIAMSPILAPGISGIALVYTFK